MKNHLKKFIVFTINVAVILVGVFFIRNYEKNKISAETDALLNPQTQNQGVEVNLSELKEIEPESIANDAVSQADSSISNVIDNTASAASAASKASPSPAPVSSNSLTKKSSSSSKKSSNSSSSSSSSSSSGSSTPKTKTS